ncbi:hypothetical protein [Ammoniphilus sp. CFH 90114]|uniref:hypothetical protein n=1 Tax=Ammoniphilus sp. CFH 90114 TaxID=2493665 RepID=UPI00100EEE23|nr:hypothetical protein [Ammoniphilus sp. CFH 90114]RXT06987.1 hypothetical protein EIZ39_12575 [Ammoniphilus sp. CFH 90114]
MIKGFLGILFALLGACGLFWWHEVLWSSGGPDEGRNVIQYITPYFITSVILFVGLYFFIRSVNKFIRRI